MDILQGTAMRSQTGQKTSSYLKIKQWATQLLWVLTHLKHCRMN